MKLDPVLAKDSTWSDSANAERNPLPARAKELESFFFGTPGTDSTHRLSSAVATPQTPDLPPTVGLFYDPFTATANNMELW